MIDVNNKNRSEGGAGPWTPASGSGAGTSFAGDC
ncbi:MAG: hypothetical protein JWM77_4126 [Rhodospirillales bacterium]|nr:hypothetical protein [Rhodospirillales bacterium]